MNTRKQSEAIDKWNAAHFDETREAIKKAGHSTERDSDQSSGKLPLDCPHMTCEEINHLIFERDRLAALNKELAEALEESCLWICIAIPFVPDKGSVEDTNAITGERLSIRPLRETLRAVDISARAVLAKAKQ